ncbi:MAG TPA: prephenate dehydrogenase/arogenate dehydrogenase family protein [Terriglobales bacterium]|nr:prephenate dehydrogenase/arogenate dehydrogenase family protein [Terriglobales bacterium]
MFKQITIVGTGLIGGSVGLALKRARFRGKVIGCDEPAVLAVAQKRKAIDRGARDCGQALRGSDLVVLATPVGAIIDLLDRFGPSLGKNVFVTDVGSTKAEIVACAQRVFGRDAARRFLGGHPMAGKELGGIEHADAQLFRGRPWFMTPLAGQELDEGPAAAWTELLGTIGARVMTQTADRHDRMAAWTSHLPQMLSTALASTLEDFRERFAEEFGDDLDPEESGGRALREMTRIAASPYEMWRDIALTNTTNIADALLQLEQKLMHMRENLRTRGLEEEFCRARGQNLKAEAQGTLRDPRSKNKKKTKQT